MDRQFLLPSEYTVVSAPYELATILGSCVSVTLWHPTKGYAAMNHFLLPEPTGAVENKGRYGSTSTSYIIEQLKILDPDIGRLRAEIYGGGAVVESLKTVTNIGESNIAIAREILHAYKICVTNEDVGGTKARRIFKNTLTGKVRVQTIEKTGLMKAGEKKHARKIQRKIRVLIVDDSLIVRAHLRKAVQSSSDMEVCGEAGDAFEANDLIMSVDPDVISLDIMMPKMSGRVYLKKLMEHYPRPVVICSSAAKEGSHLERELLRNGATAIVDKAELSASENRDNLREIYLPVLRKAAKTSYSGI